MEHLSSGLTSFFELTNKTCWEETDSVDFIGNKQQQRLIWFIHVKHQVKNSQCIQDLTDR